MVAAAAMCLVAALAAPTAGAATGNASKAKSASSAQAAKAAKQAKARAAVTKKRLALKIRNNRRYIRGTRKLMRRLGGRLRAAISGGDKSIDDKINGIVAVVTPVLQQLGEGSLALKAGLEQLAAATTAGFDEVKAGFDEVEAGFGEVEAALTDIGDFLGATEYGFAQVLVADPTPGAESGSFVVTPNIPDDVQQAQSHQVFIAQASGALVVAYGIRSNENDVDDTPGHCRVYVRNEANDMAQTTGEPEFGGLPFAEVEEGGPVTNETETTFPFGPVSTDNTDNTLVTSVMVTAGDSYEVGLSCLDTTADADDPNA